MKTYTVLRNNLEFGPYTTTDLEFYGLTSSDLVWIDGESRSWQHPDAIDELKLFAGQGIKNNFPTTSIEGNDAQYPSDAASLQEPSSHPTTVDRFQFGESRNPFSTNGKTAAFVANVVGLVILAVGVFITAFMVKTMINSFGADEHFSGQAREITPEVLAMANSSHTAKAEVTNLPPALMDTPLVKNEMVPINLVKVSPKQSSPEKSKKPANNDEPFAAIDEDESSTNVSGPVAEKQEIITAVVQKPSLQLSANDYKVGLFGGISDLELSVYNPSIKTIDRATIEVEFLKPNGNVVKSHILQVENISPNSSKSISVPSSSRGVKVRYHIVAPDSSSLKSAITNT